MFRSSVARADPRSAPICFASAVDGDGSPADIADRPTPPVNFEAEIAPILAMAGYWGALHRNLPLAVCRSQAHYLRFLGLTVEDDLLSSLLLRKLQMADIVADGAPRRFVRINADVTYSIDAGAPCTTRIVHAACSDRDGTSVVSWIGIGLLGLCSGGTLYWPDRGGGFAALRVHAVETGT